MGGNGQRLILEVVIKNEHYKVGESKGMIRIDKSIMWPSFINGCSRSKITRAFKKEVTNKNQIESNEQVIVSTLKDGSYMPNSRHNP